MLLASAFSKRAGIAVALLALTLGIAFSPPVWARGGQAPRATVAGPAFEAIVIDVESGQVLRSANADALTYPASLTKMMTLYLTFEALNSGRLRADQFLPVSAEAAAHAPTKLGLQPGDSVAVRDLILGLVTRSANDAAGVLAEALGGSESAFAERMTQKARQLGMFHTQYRNASGLPDPDQQTTARDQAKLALALYRDFPREYRFFATREFEFRGRTIRTHNHLLEWYEGADGIKTGYVHASGFNLAASAVRGGHRLIAVIMGGNSAHSRDVEMGNLLDQGFADLGTALVAQRGGTIAPAPVAAPGNAVPTPLPAAPMTTPAPAPIVAATGPAERGVIGSMREALHHLSPVSRAEAATPVREPAGREPGDDWSIQLGAFRSEAAAERAAHHVGTTPVGRGKQQAVLQPGRGEHVPLYRARLFPFTAANAKAACAALHRKGIECTVVRPTAKVASR